MSEAQSQHRAGRALKNTLNPILEELAGDPLALRWLGGHLISAGVVSRSMVVLRRPLAPRL